jgi:teichuronic acid exporter
MNNILKSGLIWSTIEVLIKRTSDFVVKMILARLLFPEDFGIIGMATVFISFIQVLNDGGMGLAIVQKKVILKKDLNTVFWTNVFWSLSLFLFLSFVAAPLAASFYSQPILIKIIPVLSLSILTRSLNTVHMAQLKREMSFKKITFVNNTSSIISGTIAIILAFLNFGIWALVANTVLAYVITIPLFYNATKWVPSLQWDKSSFKEILSFGVYTTGSNVILNLVGNADYLLIGKWFGSSATGAYTLAFMMTNLVSAQITMMLDRVMFPFYSSIQDDIEKLKRYYLKVIGFYVLLLYPIMLTLFFFSDILVPLFFGDKWGETIIPLKLLALAVMIKVLTSGYNLLFRSIGQPKYEFKIQKITSLFIYLPCLSIGIYNFGIIGAAVGVLLSTIITFFVNQYVLSKYFKIKMGQVFKEIYKVIYLCVSLAILVFTLRFFKINEFFIFGFYLLLFGISYFVLFKVIIIKILNKK